MTTQDRVPTGDDGGTTWETVGADTEWEAIDDPVGTPDNDTTYLSQTNGNQTTPVFSFTAFSINSIAIAKVIVTFRSRHLTGNATTLATRTKVNGFPYAGANQAQVDTYENYTEELLTNPDTGLAWVEADVEGTGANPLEAFAVRNGGTGAGEEVRCTQGYITVDYTPAAAGGGILARHPALRQPLLRM